MIFLSIFGMALSMIHVDDISRRSCLLSFLFLFFCWFENTNVYYFSSSLLRLLLLIFFCPVRCFRTRMRENHNKRGNKNSRFVDFFSVSLCRIKNKKFHRFLSSLTSVEVSFE
jgi:hypothetical protein